MIGAIVVIAAAVFFASNLFGGSGEMVIVPNVIDYTQEEAEDALENAGFNVEYGKAVNDDKVEEGHVVDQTPDGNKEAPEGSTVTLTLSKGPVPVRETEVPNITGKTADEAEALLTSANLKGQAHEEANEAEAGTVFKQGKNTGEVVKEGTVIEYWVSTGPDTIDVPNLTGKTKEQAIEALGDKLSYTFSSDYSATVPAGSVISYEPGGSVKPGTTIKIVLSQGPEPVAKVNAPNFVNDSASHAKPQLESLGFKVVVNGPADGIIVSQSASGSLDKGTTITLTTQARTDANTED